MSESDISPQHDEQDDDQDDDQDDRDPLLAGARRGVRVHSIVALVICVLLVALNVALVPQLIWWPFPVVGLLLGLGVHWWYGYDRLEEQLRRQQQQTEVGPGTAPHGGVECTGTPDANRVEPHGGGSHSI